MIPTKLEDHIKNKLLDREITPSIAAWDNLSGQLKNSRKPKKLGYFKYAVAASIIVLFGVGVYFVSDINSKEDGYKIVDKQQNLPELEYTVHPDLERSISSKGYGVVKNKASSNYSKNNLSHSNKPLLVSKEILVLNKKLRSDEMDKKHDRSTIENNVINVKISQLLAVTNTLKNEIDELSNAEVDTLLRQAQREILAEREIFNASSNNALALLSEAEQELDASFKEQIFLSLKQKFLKMKTAVATRNN